jgi:hydroxypyruvate isomerase
MTRRSFIPAVAGSALAGAQTVPRKGRLKQSVTRGCFGKKGMSLEDMAREAARLGAKGFDLIGPQDWPVLKKYGLAPSMSPGGATIAEGINRKENHAVIEPNLREIIMQAAEAGVPNVIMLSGNRRGLPDEQGIENCATFLNKMKPLAEDKGVTICLELLNSKVNHPDYHCDHTRWGVEVMKRVNSPRVKLLYDIYHMQIMEGDIIRTIKDNIQYLGHFHTAGVPGRHEMDNTQELNYRPIAEAIVAAGFTGYMAHEYSPLRDPLKSLDEALALCDV